ncbi:hypothetical protein BU26DRAFT_604299 [Trematosphaeria pertusa]|uniref:Transcription elongation factor Eaf N-terminal domain-containing protein n=1 Tax=Trematosphaeria pertusa TaxID=390896 RepID=A0A6A6IJ10_9PLEO|nr:uncharacterized protein BU26DRAFT_604299 [Trematosphaeria pertusa]KAF2250038.1 hypothetical protein BU26DRAFT_604299 [Trematosphaeria pertusa]
MASPMVEGRVDPHKKAHFSLHISDRITKDNGELGSYSSVKYNHKPAQSTTSRTTTLTSTTANTYNLRLEDEKKGNKKDIFVFKGQKTVPKKSYILLLDPASQKATLEPLSSTYTFNLTSKNGADVSSSYPKLYPRKQKEDVQDAGVADDLFDEGGAGDDPDPENPYDFRHFLNKEKRGDESEYNIASSPDYRTGTGSAMNTPQFPARKPASAVSSKPKPTAQAAPKPKKRKPDPKPLVSKKAEAKKQQAPPIRLERRATEQKKPQASAAKPSRKAAAPPPSAKIKSAEIVHSSDESDTDAEPDHEPELVSSPPRTQRSPSPVQRRQLTPESDEDETMEDAIGGALGLEIEVPDARPSKPRHNALKSLGLGPNLGLGYRKSPSNGPISLVSATNSVEGSPNPHTFTPRKNRAQEEDGVIDFGNFGGRADDEDEEEADDGDVEPMDIGPPAQAQRIMSVGGGLVNEADAEGEEEDPLYKEMMEGLAGGESSEESEEE